MSARPTRILLAALIVAAWAPRAGSAPPAADERPRTRAERTDYRETSSLDDVTAFLGRLAARGGPVSFREIGRSAGDRPILLAVAARRGSESPAGARAAGKLVVYVQATIHGGEVEGKEAALMLLRELARRPDHPLLERLVLLVVPVYNVDGNEALGDGATLRPSQDGPGRVGRRPNGAGLDLNRDAMKAQAPETRAVLRHVYRAWEPDAVLDLHTTNGTRHGFHLTYSPPLNPTTDPGVLAYCRDVLLPSARERLARESGRRVFDYGNVEDRPGGRGWYTFGDEGRYVTNYAGLRGRVAVLSEAASFLPFRTRVETTLAFVRAVLDRIAGDADRVRTLLRDAAARAADPKATPRSVVVRSEPSNRGREPVPLEVVRGGAPVDHRKAPTRVEDRVLPVFDRFRATRTAEVPVAYLVPADLTEVVALLRRHGASVERLTREWRGDARRFIVGEAVVSDGRFQGGRSTRLEGRFEATEASVPAGTFVVRTAQPLRDLIALLLEPESLDGVAAWGLLDGRLAAGAPFPILKASRPTWAATEPLP